jgi:hypothetical protein
MIGFSLHAADGPIGHIAHCQPSHGDVGAYSGDVKIHGWSSFTAAAFSSTDARIIMGCGLRLSELRHKPVFYFP